MQAQTTCGAPNRRAVKGSCFKDHRCGLIRNLRLKPPHNACKPCWFLCICNDKLISRGNMGGIIERMQAFPLVCAACNERMTCNSIVIIGMQRLPKLQHNKVRYVNNIVDGANARPLQALYHPRRRRRHLYTAQKTCRKPTTELRRFNTNSYVICSALPFLRYFYHGDTHRLPGQYCNLTCNPKNTETVSAVCRQLKF